MLLAEVQFYNKNTKNIKSDTIYTYKIPIGLKLKKNDIALVYVDNCSKDTSGYKTVKIYNIIKEQDYNGNYKTQEMKWILSKLDFSFLEKTYEKINKRDDLLRKIDETYKKASKIQLLEMMAKNNPELKEMVMEYKELDGEL